MTEKKNKSKEIGNRFEREVARQLSIWMFDDEHTLKREPTSGAVKNVYTGDIFPMKQLEWEYWPFHIECKYGYEEKMPTLLNFKIIEGWYLQCVAESTQCNNKQEIILLICNFKAKRGTLLCTNKELSCVRCNCILKIGCHDVYCYNYKDMIGSYTFVEVFA